MGVMRFLVHPASRLAGDPNLFRAYIGAPDQSVHPTRVEVQNDVLTCRRATSDSGKLYIPWPVEGFGRPVIGTASLREREEPYLLTVELARGKIVQVRNQLSVWEQAGMQVPPEFGPLSAEAHTLFSRAAAVQDDAAQATTLGDAALRVACQSAELLAQTYSQQSLAVRHRRYTQLPMLLGCRLPHDVPLPERPELFAEAFNAATIPLEWRFIEPAEGDYRWDVFDAQVDWCAEQKIVPRGGPLLDFSPGGLPGWLEPWGHDPLNLQSFVCDFVETVIRRYLGRVRIWEICARANSGGVFTLGEEDRLCLVAKALEIARSVDTESLLFVRIDQPWGEYQARGQHKLAPLQFADALLRTGIGLSGINLEIAVGYRPRGSMSHDLLDYSRLIDMWSTLSVPLQVTLAFPSQSGNDPVCTTELEVDRDCWKRQWDEAAQAEWLDLHLPLLVAKPTVTGVFWSQFTDAHPHTFPHAGLICPEGRARPALGRIAEHRRNYLR